MKIRTGAVALLAVTLLATGCSSTAAAPPAESAAASPTPKTEPSTPTPTPEQSVHAIGETVDLGSTSSLAVLGYEPASAPEAPLPEAADSHWVSIEVQVCNKTSQDGTTGTSPWTLRDTESRSYSSSNTGYAQFPNPQYAWGDVDLFAGDCLRGWITYPVLNDATLTTVRYVSPSTGDRVEWTLG